MKPICIFLVTLLFIHISNAQRVTKILLLGEKGIVKDFKLAKSFIVMKKYPDGTYQRVNYKKGGPMESLQTYGDSSLSFFEGNYYKYNSGGYLSCKGYYSQNKKDSTWFYYNDSLKIIRMEIYKEGELIKTIEPDTARRDFALMNGFQRIDAEPSFPRGKNAWSKYLNKHFYDKVFETFDKDVVARSVKGGKVIIHFLVNETGDVKNIAVWKSVEYILDEEAIRLIRDSPVWNPATSNGLKVKAYRLQSIDFAQD